jgi:WD40 repeat protein
LPNAIDDERYIFVDGFIYIYMSSFYEESSTKNLTVTKVDIAKNTSEVVYQENDVTDILGNIWVTEDHELYLSGSTDEKAYLWKIENGSKKEITFWPVDEVNVPDVMDGIVMFMTRDENNIRYVDIRNFSGETIYKGKLFPSAISGLEKNPNTYSFAVVGGDTEKIIINLIEFSDKTMVNYTILIDLKDNMKATILWSSEE